MDSDPGRTTGQIQTSRAQDLILLSYFGGDSWDIIKDRSGALGPLIESVVELYRSKGHPAKAVGTGIDDFVPNKSKNL